MPPSALHQHNASLLRRYRLSRDQRERNRLVETNLPLVRQVAARLSCRTRLPFDDLMQLGCLGLIRAIEAFDPAQGTALSSFAVPYIRGAMQQHLRDREQPMRCSRQLRDLHRRGQALQQERLHHHLPPLDEQAMAAALSCPPERWREACALQRALQMRSLDAPVRVGEESDIPLVELIPSGEAPHPCRADHREESPCCEPESQHWLRQRLRRLDPLLRQLFEGRVLNGASWRQLGEDVGLHARVAQRRFDALVVQLREEFGTDLGDLFSPPSRAAAPGPSPAGRRSASAAHSPVHC